LTVLPHNWCEIKKKKKKKKKELGASNYMESSQIKTITSWNLTEVYSLFKQQYANVKQ
jgi:hypothetical protein